MLTLTVDVQQRCAGAYRWSAYRRDDSTRALASLLIKPQRLVLVVSSASSWATVMSVLHCKQEGLPIGLALGIFRILIAPSIIPTVLRPLAIGSLAH